MHQTLDSRQTLRHPIGNDCNTEAAASRDRGQGIGDRLQRQDEACRCHEDDQQATGKARKGVEAAHLRAPTAQARSC